MQSTARAFLLPTSGLASDCSGTQVVLHRGIQVQRSTELLHHPLHVLFLHFRWRLGLGYHIDRMHCCAATAVKHWWWERTLYTSLNRINLRFRRFVDVSCTWNLMDLSSLNLTDLINNLLIGPWADLITVSIDLVQRPIPLGFDNFGTFGLR
jgi:hypothetical protein